MDVSQLREYMRSSGELNKPNADSVAWKHAFKLYKQAQGVRVEMDCSGCWRRVTAWIRND